MRRQGSVSVPPAAVLDEHVVIVRRDELDDVARAARLDERERLALDLHDGALQLVTGALQRSDALERSVDDPDTVSAIRDLRQVLRALEDELRSVVAGRQPQRLMAMGLVPAIWSHMVQLQARSGGIFRLAVQGEAVSLPGTHELAIYRIVQESLQNAHDHAAATQIDVRLDYRSTSIRVIIEDNGRGMASGVAANQSSRTHGGLGLTSMRRRAADIGGRLKIASGAWGTRIDLKVPVPSIGAS